MKIEEVAEGRIVDHSVSLSFSLFFSASFFFFSFLIRTQHPAGFYAAVDTSRSLLVRCWQVDSASLAHLWWQISGNVSGKSRTSDWGVFGLPGISLASRWQVSDNSFEHLRSPTALLPTSLPLSLTLVGHAAGLSALDIALYQLLACHRTLALRNSSYKYTRLLWLGRATIPSRKYQIEKKPRLVFTSFFKIP